MLRLPVRENRYAAGEAAPAVTVVGGGLAGCEAAWQASRLGCRVTLFEMRPTVMTPAHHTGLLAELVCSNSLRSDSLENAVGLLKEEMRRLGSLIMECGEKARIPAGKALAVDRDVFARTVTEAVERAPGITVRRAEVKDIPAGTAVIATGPLTSADMAAAVRRLCGQDHLYFFDAASPIVTYESIDGEKVFRASRYGRGDDYLNCPLSRAEYERFREELLRAEQHPRHPFEEGVPFFEGCLPVEELARRGEKTLLFGPMKPVGLIDPRTGRQPYAVVQLRRDNREGTLYNLVGFQTNLKWPEQKRVFRLIPGLEKAEFVRYGVMHRNTYIKSPVLLMPTLQLRARPEVLFAGQITGVEGYMESAGTGLVAGINAARHARGEPPVVFPPGTALGALCRYITEADPGHFQPMNVNYGLFPALPRRVRDRRRRAREMAERALEETETFMTRLVLDPFPLSAGSTRAVTGSTGDDGNHPAPS